MAKRQGPSEKVLVAASASESMTTRHRLAGARRYVHGLAAGLALHDRFH